MTFEPRPRTATGADALLGLGEEGLLGGPAGVAERDPLRGVEAVHPARAAWRRRRRPGPGPCCRRRAGCARRRPGGSGRGRPPASVTAIRVKSVVPPPTSQTRRMSPTLTCFRQRVALGGEPGVEGGLRLLQERDLLEPRRAGGLDGQLAGHGVERGGDGQQDVLVLEPVGGRLAGDPVVPGVAEVGQVGGRRLDRRDLGDVLGGASRAGSRPRRSTPGVRQPALGRADQPARDLRPVLARERARRPGPAGDFQGRSSRPGGELLGGGQVQERGQDRPLGRRRSAPTTCGIAQRLGSAPGASAVGLARCRRRPGRSWSFPGRCRRRSGTWALLGVDRRTRVASDGGALRGSRPRPATRTDVSSRVAGRTGQVDGLDPPAVVLEDALERGRAVDVADQADRGRVEVGRRR